LKKIIFLIFFSKQPEIKLNWEKENAKGKVPLERGFHTSTIVSGTKIFYTGGDAKNTYFKGKQNLKLKTRYFDVRHHNC
jgi:hypothetical protein